MGVTIIQILGEETNDDSPVVVFTSKKEVKKEAPKLPPAFFPTPQLEIVTER